MSVIRVSFCLLVGALVPQLSSFPPSSDQIAAVLVLLVLVLPALRRTDVICVFLGSALFFLHVETVVASRWHADNGSESMLIVARIVDFPESRRATTSFTAMPLADERVPSRIRLSWFEAPVDLHLGDVWKLHVKLRTPRGTANPGATDTEAWLTRHRIGATGYIVDSVLNELVDSGTAAGIDKLRLQILSRIDRQLGNHDSGSVLAAIVVGARHRLSDEQWDRYARTGTGHLMAISGLHVGLAAVGAFYAARLLLGVFGIGTNQRRIALGLSLLVAFAYAAISGFAVPAQRAALMLAIAGTALLLRRETDAARVLAIAAIVIVFADPLTTMAPGFWLSFSAVGVLYWFARRTAKPVPRPTVRPFVAIFNLAVIQLLLFLALLPLTSMIFGRVSLSAPFVNLVAVPLFSAVTVPVALSSILFAGVLEPVGAELLGIAAWSVGVIEALITIANAEPRAAQLIPGISGVAWLCLALPVVYVILPPGWPARLAGWVAVLVLLSWKPGAPPRGCTDVTVLDVGQGLAVVVRTAGRTLLYDTGPMFRNRGSAAKTVVLPFLASVGVSRIDRLVVSHGDLDHAGGVAEITNTMPVGDTISGEPLEPGIARPCHHGIAWYWGVTRFTILHPRPGSAYRGNDASCVLLIETGTRKVLLTGDIESPVEADLVRRGVLPRVDVVTVPHHGSRTSSITPFVRSLSPQYAIVSAAHGNQWGFPKPDIVARWRANDAAVLETASSGAIGVRQCVTRAGIDIERYRRRSLRIWHADTRDAEF